MSCIKENGKRCTSYCEVINIPGKGYRDMIKHHPHGHDTQKIKKYWVQITKRQAKKINPYIFRRNMDDYTKQWLKGCKFFTCKALIKNVGCSIRKIEDERPHACGAYEGGDEYSSTCFQDILREDNIIATDKLNIGV